MSMPQSISHGIRATLVTNGVNPRRAVFYSRLATNVFALVRQAHAKLCDKDNWKDFRENETKGRSVEEPDITTMIDRYSNQLLNLPENNEIRQVVAAVSSDRPVVNDRGRSGKRAKKVDLCFVGLRSSQIAPGSDEDYSLVLEAKPLKSDSDVKNRYLADEGLGCFLGTDSPYTLGPLAGMLAYCFRKDVEGWCTIICGQLPSVSSGKKEALKADDHTGIISQHCRTSKSDITIVHGLLDFNGLE